MDKLKIVWLSRVSNVYVLQGLPVPDRQADDVQVIDVTPSKEVSSNNVDDKATHIHTNKADEQPAALSPREDEKEEKNETVKPSALLMKEMDETNNWARLGAQLYFGWFTLMITVNGIAIGWLFSNKGAMPRFARLLFLFFIGLNLLGTIVAFRIRKHMLDCDVRIQVVLAGLSRHQVPVRLNFTPKSPVPREAIDTVCAFTATVLFMLLIFWTVIGIWPQTFIA